MVRRIDSEDRGAAAEEKAPLDSESGDSLNQGLDIYDRFARSARTGLWWCGIHFEGTSAETSSARWSAPRDERECGFFTDGRAEAIKKDGARVCGRRDCATCDGMG